MTFNTETIAHELDVADSFASKAINRMRQDGIPAVPQNFELWYVYYANVNPRLRDEMNEILIDKDKLTEQDCLDLYEKHLNYGLEQETYKKAGDQISATLHTVTGIMQNVKDTNSEFTNNLQKASNQLTQVDVPNEIQSILQFISAETKKMVDHNVELESRLEQSSAMVGELKRDMERIRQQAVTDGLTGLANRKAFDDQIQRIVRDSNRNSEIFSLIMIDIDHFKSFNDKYGHQVGDQVLRLVAMTLVNEVKGQDMAARYGGEEFVIILPGTNANAAQAVAENLRKAVEKKEVINRATGDNLGQITVSLGAAQFYGGEETAEELIRRADIALYQSKSKGRNQVTLALSPHEAKE
jgi:diguanylate cyclase